MLLVRKRYYHHTKQSTNNKQAPLMSEDFRGYVLPHYGSTGILEPSWEQCFLHMTSIATSQKGQHVREGPNNSISRTFSMKSDGRKEATLL